ncbi:MAG: hypothetical protein RLZZ416_611 [Candidatus Parcubacteria bacterium]
MLVKVKVRTGVRRESVRKVADDRFEIAVREKPERNAANSRVIELLALACKVPGKHVRIVKGHRSPSKTFSVGSR